jgi:plastocyanin
MDIFLRILALAGAFLIGLCLVHSQPSASIPPRIELLDREVRPEKTEVWAGRTVVIHNVSEKTHPLALEGAPWESDRGPVNYVILAPGDRITMSFARSGVYRMRSHIYSSFDGSSGMIGAIIVRDAQLADRGVQPANSTQNRAEPGASIQPAPPAKL